VEEKLLRLDQVAEKVINFLSSNSGKGFLINELVERLNIPRRRIYDVVTVLRVAGLIRVRREKKGWRVFWSTDIKSSKEVLEMRKELEEERRRREVLEREYVKVQRMLEDVLRERVLSSAESAIRGLKYSNKIKVVPINGRITRINSSGDGLIIEASGDALIVLPAIEIPVNVNKKR